MMQYRDRRKLTHFPADIIADGEVYPVSIDQVSSGGLRVSAMPSWTVFSIDREDYDLEIQVLDQRLPVRVRWQHEDRAGLQVLAPIPQNLLDRVQRRTLPI